MGTKGAKALARNDPVVLGIGELDIACDFKKVESKRDALRRDSAFVPACGTQFARLPEDGGCLG